MFTPFPSRPIGLSNKPFQLYHIPPFFSTPFATFFAKNMHKKRGIAHHVLPRQILLGGRAPPFCHRVGKNLLLFRQKRRSLRQECRVTTILRKGLCLTQQPLYEIYIPASSRPSTSSASFSCQTTLLLSILDCISKVGSILRNTWVITPMLCE